MSAAPPTELEKDIEMLPKLVQSKKKVLSLSKSEEKKGFFPKLAAQFERIEFETARSAQLLLLEKKK